MFTLPPAPLVEPERLLVELYVWLAANHTSFLSTESWSRRSSPRFEKFRSLFADALEGGGHWPPPFGSDQSLALLVALDEHLLAYAPGTARSAVAVFPVGQQSFQLLRRPAPFAPPIRNQRGHLSQWLRHHRVLPVTADGGFVIRIAPADAELRRQCPGSRNGVRVYVVDFEDGVAPQPQVTGQNQVLFDGVTDADARWRSIERHLNEAVAAAAQVVVFPELTITPVLRYRISRWLEENENPFLLVLAGSFHEREGDHFYNRAQLFSGSGLCVLEHRKLTIACNGAQCEDIATGHEIALLESPIGLIATPICLDFCQGAEPVGSLWLKLGPDLVLVAAMDTDLERHAAKAKSLGLFCETCTVLANQHPRGQAGAHGLVHSAGKRLAVTPASRVFVLGKP